MEYTQNKQHHIVGALFLFCLFGIFAATSLALIVAGARIYRNTMKTMDTNYETRTAASYLTERIRQNDKAGYVSIRPLQGQDALALRSSSQNGDYITYLYFYEGYLMELYVREGLNTVGNPLTAGEKIMPLAALHMEQPRENLFSFTYTTAEGENRHILVSSRTHQE